MILLLVAYLLLAWLAGFALTFVSSMPWQLEGRLAVGMTLGFCAAAMLTWLAALTLGMSGMTVAVGAVLLALVIVACGRYCRWLPVLRIEASSAGQRWRTLGALPLAVVLALSMIYFIPFFSHALVMRPAGYWGSSPAGLYAGYITIWGDWSTHLSLAGYLSTARDLLPPQNPFFAGTNLTYSFLPDLFSGMLSHLGLTIPQSLALVSALLAISFAVIFYSTALRLTGKAWAATMGTLIFFMSGGLGFWRVLGDVRDAAGHSLSPLGWVQGLVALIGAPPHLYTQDNPHGYQWLNPVLAYLVPQRTTLFGWGLGLLVVSLLWYAWHNSLRREMVIAGVLMGAMPLFHIASYVDLGIFSAGLVVLSFSWSAFRRPARVAAGPGAVAVAPVASLESPLSGARRVLSVLWRQNAGWVYYGVAALVIGVPQALLIVPQAAYRHSFFAVHWGWMATDPDGQYRLPWLWFWLLNTGLLIPLALATTIGFTCGKPRLVRFLLPAWLLFAVSNIFQLAPWIWDNTKYLAWWAIPMAMLAGLALHQLFRGGRYLAPLGVVVLVLALASGALDLDRAVQPRLNESNLLFLDTDALAAASWAEHSTPNASVFLTSSRHNAPILTMSKRVVVMGYVGWLWSWGLDYHQRESDVREMLAGGDHATALLHSYGVGYVVIGPTEISDYGARGDYYASHYPRVYRSPAGEYNIYKVS